MSFRAIGPLLCGGILLLSAATIGLVPTAPAQAAYAGATESRSAVGIVNAGTEPVIRLAQKTQPIDTTRSNESNSRSTRSEVKDSHDRYQVNRAKKQPQANIEINYLLQRMEAKKVKAGTTPSKSRTGFAPLRPAEF